MTLNELYHDVYRHLAGGLTCKDATAAVTDYLERRMDFTRWVRFQMHLGLCPGCRVYVRQMKLTIRTMRGLPTEPPSPAVREDLLRRFRERRLTRI